MRISCLDLEGVLVPEIWIGVAEKTRITELRRTTRDEPDYGKLMHERIKILRENNLKLKDVRDVIDTLKPLPGAKAFLDDLRSKTQVLILSDTFYEFAGPLMEKLGRPTLFCNRLLVDRKGFISGFELRQKDGKRKAVDALVKIGFRVRSAGDSFNDLTMLGRSERGFLFNPPPKIAAGYGRRFPVVKSYSELLVALTR